MMNRVTILGQCRLAYSAVRAQQAVVDNLQKSVDIALDGQLRGAYDRRLEEARDTLMQLRAHYDQLYPVALAGLSILDGREYDVCWRFYLMGQTIGEIAYLRGEAPRTVSRAKAEGLKRLEDYIQHE